MLLTVMLNFLFLVKFLYHTLKGMSRSVHPAAPSASKTNNGNNHIQEKCREEVSTSTSKELSVLRVADVKGPLKVSYVESGLFFREFWRKNYESASPDGLENVSRIEKIYKLPRRNLLHTFIKTSNLGKHQRRRLLACSKNEPPRNNICANYDTFNELNPEGQIRRLRSQLSKDKRVIYTVDIGKLGRRIKWHQRGASYKDILSNMFYQSLPSVESISFVQGGPFKSNALLDRPSNVWDFEDEYPCFKDVPDNTNTVQDVADLFKKLDLNEGSSTSVAAEGEDSSQDNSSNWSNTPLNSGSQFLDEPLDPQPKMDFSCGDDSRNAEENAEGIDQICESKVRSVQWNNEVDVIYYAGDADGGKIIRREREPLQEEADQQARNKFIQLMLNKSLISSMSGY